MTQLLNNVPLRDFGGRKFIFGPRELQYMTLKHAQYKSTSVSKAINNRYENERVYTTELITKISCVIFGEFHCACFLVRAILDWD